MIKHLFFIVLGILLFAETAVAEKGPFGLGAIIGEPTGVCFKYYLEGNTKAIDGAVAWALSGDNEFHIHSDFLYHYYDVIDVKRGELPIYCGIGGRIKFEDNNDNNVGVRFPVGLDYIFADNVPFDIFLEIVPILELAPDTDFGMEGAVGFRFFF